LECFVDIPDAPALPRPAGPELRALAATTRPDWDTEAVVGAMADAHMSGMSWAEVLKRMGALMADPDAAPRDLTAHVWKNNRRGSGGPPPAYRKARDDDPLLASRSRMPATGAPS
jgi:hypothetical protein